MSEHSSSMQTLEADKKQINRIARQQPRGVLRCRRVPAHTERKDVTCQFVPTSCQFVPSSESMNLRPGQQQMPTSQKKEQPDPRNTTLKTYPEGRNATLKSLGETPAGLDPTKALGPGEIHGHTGQSNVDDITVGTQPVRACVGNCRASQRLPPTEYSRTRKMSRVNKTYHRCPSMDERTQWNTIQP